jgi:hypothetical protein
MSAPERRRARSSGHFLRKTRVPRRNALATVATALVAAVVASGCGSVAAPRAAAPARRPTSLPLATALAGDQTTWAVVPMGATAGANLFWQLFTLPAHGSRWTLATPPDVATNGAIALGVQGGRSLVAGIHPSLLLDFSPITSTADGGRKWAVGAPDAGLANVPDALASAPDGGQLIALDRTGNVELTGGSGQAGGAGWRKLTSTRTLASGRTCRLGSLAAVAFSPAGSPVVAGNCTRPGAVGIFADQAGAWHTAGPALPAALRSQPVRVLRLTRTGSRLTALLQVGTGKAASLLLTWLAGDGQWTESAALPLAGRAVLSSSFGSDGAAAVELTGQRAELVTGPGAAWQALPSLPPGRTVTLALPIGGGVDALVTGGNLLTVWRVAGSRWTKAQTTNVPIQYGSSS